MQPPISTRSSARYASGSFFGPELAIHRGQTDVRSLVLSCCQCCRGSFPNGPRRLVNAFAEGRPLRILPPMNAQVGD